MGKVLLAYNWIENGDYGVQKEIAFEVIDEEKLNDMNGLMEEYDIKHWVTSKTPVEDYKDWEPHSAALLEYRYFTVKPMRVVESWGYIRETGEK